MSKIGFIPVIIAIFLFLSGVAWGAESSASAGFRFGSFTAEGSFPIDGAGGQVAPRAVSYYYDSNFMNTNTAFEGIFAGPYISVTSSKWGQNTDLDIGGRLFGLIHFAGDYVKYNNGNYIPSETFNGSYYGGELFVSKDFSDTVSGKLAYSITRNNYYRNTDTNPVFILPLDNTTQAITFRIESRNLTADPWGDPKTGYRVWTSSEFYSSNQYQAWGLAPSLSAGAKDYQKFEFMSGFYYQPWGDNSGTMAFTVNGRYGSNLDRLTMFSLGGASSVQPDSYMLHGYYVNEFYVDNLTLFNWEYSLPLFRPDNTDGKTVKAYFAYDWATIPSGNLGGIGIGIKWPIFSGGALQLDYGYGMDAIRNGIKGGHGITLKYEQLFSGG